MFKNSVFKPNVDTMKWVKASLKRAIKTLAQTLGSYVVVGLSISEIDWKLALSVSVVAFVSSIITSIAGIPEVPSDEN